MAQKKIDVYGIDVTKALIFIFGTMAAGITLTVLVIIPGIREFKIRKVENQHAYVQLRQVKEIYQEKMGEYNRLKEKNLVVIESLQGVFNNDEFAKLGKRHFAQFKNTPVENGDFGKHFNRETQSIQVAMDNPAAIFGYITELNRQRTIYGIEFPLTIKAEQHGTLYATFPVHTYTVSESNSSLKSIAPIASE